MKYRFIINKHSGNGTGKKDISTMRQYFSRSIGTFDYAMPDSREEAVEITRKMLKDGVERIVAVGGDGTVNAIVNGFFEDGQPINSEAELVVARAGSGYDYYSSVTRYKKPKSWMELAVNCDARPVDIGCIRFEDPAFSDRYFINMASVGMIADIAERKERSSNHVPMALCYVLPTITSLFSYEPQEYEIRTDDGDLDLDVLTVSISKGAFAGGGMRFGLDVKLDDGLFEVTVIKKSTALGMALKLGKIFTGNYANEKEIIKLRTSTIDIRTKNPAPCESDGEVYGKTNISVKIAPKAVKVCFPL